jgi:hypothetical protein
MLLNCGNPVVELFRRLHNFSDCDVFKGVRSQEAFLLGLIALLSVPQTRAVQQNSTHVTPERRNSVLDVCFKKKSSLVVTISLRPPLSCVAILKDRSSRSIS